MAIGPISMGATRPSWTVTVLKADNSALDLTGATYTGVLYETRTANRKTLTTGNYSTTNATSGIFTYAPGSTDTDTPGIWDFETVITIGGQTYYITVPSIQILPRKAP
jgi:hypothetical protein